MRRILEIVGLLTFMVLVALFHEPEMLSAGPPLKWTRANDIIYSKSADSIGLVWATGDTSWLTFSDSLLLDFGTPIIIDSSIMDSMYLQVGRFAAGGGGGSVDSAGLDFGSGSYKWTSVKAWAMKLDASLSFTTPTDSAGIDTTTLSADTTLLATLDALNDTAASKLDADGSVTADYLVLSPLSSPSHIEGRLFYDADAKAPAFHNNESAVTLQIGQEQWVRVRNTTGVTITDGQVVYINGAATQLPTIALADADFEAMSDLIGVATQDIANNSNGFVTVGGMVNGINTSGFPDGTTVYISSTPGAFDSVTVLAPSHRVEVGTIAYSHVSAGRLFVHPGHVDHLYNASDVLVTGRVEGDILLYSVNGSDTLWTDTSFSLVTGVYYDSAMTHLDGMAYDKQEVLSIVDATGLQVDVEKEGGGNIIYRIDGVESTLDCLTGAGAGGKARVAIAAGSDANTPQVNYIYVTNSGGTATLESSTSLPSGSFAWVGKVIVPDATTFGTTGAYLVQRYTEAFVNNNRGTESNEREKLRSLGALYHSGVDPMTLSIYSTPNPDTLHYEVSSGLVYQLHRQSFPSRDNGPYHYGNGLNIYEQFGELGSALAEQDGTSLANSYFNLVIWGAVNQDTGSCKLFVNLPNGSYSTSSGAMGDANNTADYTVPINMKSVAFLIGRIAVRHQSAASGTWTEQAVYSLLGQPVGIRGSGVVAGPASNEFDANLWRLFDPADATKLLAFQLSSITTGNTRTLTIPDDNGTILLAASLNAYFDTAAVVDTAQALIALAVHDSTNVSDSSLSRKDINWEGGLDDSRVQDNITVNEASDVDTSGTKIAPALNLRGETRLGNGILNLTDGTQDTLAAHGDTLQVDTTVVSTKGHAENYADSVATVTQTSLTVQGDINISGSVVQLNRRHDLYLNESHAVNADTILHLPIPDCGGSDSLSSSIPHFSVLYFPKRKFGYKYHAVYSDFSGTCNEDTRYAVSNNAMAPLEPFNTGWHVFIDSTPGSPTFGDPGESIILPISDIFPYAPDTANLGFISDPDLFFDAEGLLWCVNRIMKKRDTNFTDANWSDSTTLVVISTTDGITWTAPDTILGPFKDTTLAGVGRDVISPAVVMDSSGTFKLWALERAKGGGKQELVIYEAPNADSGWILIDTCTGAENAAGDAPWHIEVVQFSADLLFGFGPHVQNSGYLMGIVSRDNGLTWDTTGNSILTPHRNYSDTIGWDSDGMYRGSGYFVELADRMVFDLFYIGRQTAAHAPSSSETFHVGYTQLDFTGYTNTETVIVPATFIHGNADLSGDSVVLGLEAWAIVGSDLTAFLGRDTSENGDQIDTIMVSFAELPQGIVSIDTVVLVFTTTSTTANVSEIHGVRILGHSLTGGRSVMADSIIGSNDAAKFASSANVWKRQPWLVSTNMSTGIPVNTTDDKIAAEDQTALMIISQLDAGEKLYIGRAFLKCTVRK